MNPIGHMMTIYKIFMQKHKKEIQNNRINEINRRRDQRG